MKLRHFFLDLAGMRKYRSESEWREIINRYETGEQKSAEFCEAEGISKSGLSKWRSRLLGSTKFQGRFVELKPETGGDGKAVELQFPSGLVLRITV